MFNSTTDTNSFKTYMQEIISACASEENIDGKPGFLDFLASHSNLYIGYDQLVIQISQTKNKKHKTQNKKQNKKLQV